MKLRSGSWKVAVAVLAVMGLCGARAQAEGEVEIKLGTLAPAGSPWHNLLKETASRWTEISAGKVKLRVYAGGVSGDESQMIKKMAINQLQAAGLSSVGLHEITPEPLGLDLPLMVNNHGEKDYLIEKLGPKLEKALLAKGFVVLSWTDVGMVHFFSTKSRATLGDMQGGKLFAWEGDADALSAWRKAGFHPVVLSSTDILPSLQTGMIDTVAYPPVVALAIRMHLKAKYMSDLPWASLTGAMVIEKRVWDKVPADLQPKLLEVSRQVGGKARDEARKLEQDALTKMKAQGLTVVAITDRPAWDTMVKGVYESVRGKVVPAATFDEVQRLLKEYRSQHAAN